MSNPSTNTRSIGMHIVLAVMLTVGWAPSAARAALIGGMLQEPDNSTGTASLIRLFEFAQSGISPAADKDIWRTPGAAVGELIFAYVDTSSSAASMDSVLDVLANDGTTVIESDNDDGPGLGSVVAGAIVPQDGNVFFQITESGNNETMSYRLFQAVMDAADSVSELEPNNTPATANIISMPIIHGNVASGSGDVDYFRFFAPYFAYVAVVMDENPENDGVITDTTLTIYDTDETTVLAIGDNLGVTDGNAAGAYVPPGTYFIHISDNNQGSAYSFVLLVDGIPYSDADADNVADTDDNCPNTFNPTQVDADGDGFGDPCDACPTSFLKQSPGACGCDEPDVDIDGDGVVDCGLADPARSLLSGAGLILVPDSFKRHVLGFDPLDGDLVDASFVPADAVNLDVPITALLGPDQNSIIVSDAALEVVQQFDLDGTFQQTFAPAGGADNSILGTHFGMTFLPNGDLLVASAGGANANAVAQFDAEGNFLGNLVAPATGGLSGPTDVLVRADELLVLSLSFNDNSIKIFDADSGAFIGDFATFGGDSAPQQIVELADGHILVANFLGLKDRGIREFAADGTPLDEILLPANLNEINSVAELGNGNLLVGVNKQFVIDPSIISGGVFEVDRDGNMVNYTLIGGVPRHIEYALQDSDGDGVGDDLDGCPSDPAKTAPGVCGCGVADGDGDGDGVLDCNDQCPGADDTLDADGDGPADGCDDTPMGQCCGGGLPLTTPLLLLGWGWVRRRRSTRSIARTERQ